MYKIIKSRGRGGGGDDILTRFVGIHDDGCILRSTVGRSALEECYSSYTRRVEVQRPPNKSDDIKEAGGEEEHTISANVIDTANRDSSIATATATASGASSWQKQTHNVVRRQRNKQTNKHIGRA
jgi:hypothetical protein